MDVLLQPLGDGEEVGPLPADYEILHYPGVCAQVAPQPLEIWTAWFGMALGSIDHPAEAGRRYGEVERTGRISRDQRDFGKFGYRDSNIALVVVPVADGIEFELENLTSYAEKIIWDEVAFVDFDRSSHRVMHAGVRYLDRSQSQPPSVVPPHKLLRDSIVPVNRVQQGKKGFVHRPLIGSLLRRCIGETEKEFVQRSQSLKGGSFGILLPVEVAGVVNEYMLNFQIENVELRRERGCPDPIEVAEQETIHRGDW